MSDMRITGLAKPADSNDEPSKDGDVMEHKEMISLFPETDAELEGLAARIRPLPREVAPSAEFMSRTRLRLLQLPAQVAIEESRRAA
ncbi:MAG TPA: hypothetical protein VI876_11690 [Dehalococcoidia bacterium]|nr:hypothetical protein [Dehalococcoidia bacterium]